MRRIAVAPPSCLPSVPRVKRDAVRERRLTCFANKRTDDDCRTIDARKFHSVNSAVMCPTCAGTRFHPFSSTGQKTTSILRARRPAVFALFPV